MALKKNTAVELMVVFIISMRLGAMVGSVKPLYRADAIPNNSIYAVYNRGYDTSQEF